MTEFYLKMIYLYINTKPSQTSQDHQTNLTSLYLLPKKNMFNAVPTIEHAINNGERPVMIISNSIIFRINSFIPQGIEKTREFIRFLDDDFVVFGSIIFNLDFEVEHAGDLDIMVNNKGNQNIIKILRFQRFLGMIGYNLKNTSSGFYGDMSDLHVASYFNRSNGKKIDIAFVEEDPATFLKKKCDIKACSGVFNGLYITSEVLNEDGTCPVQTRIEQLDLDKFIHPENVFRLAKYLSRNFMFLHHGTPIPYHTENEFSELNTYLSQLRQQSSNRASEPTSEALTVEDLELLEA